VHRLRVEKWIGQPAYLEVFTGRSELLKTVATERQQFGVRAVIFSDGPQAREPRLVPTTVPNIDPRAHELAWQAMSIERELPLPEYYCGVSEPEVGLDRPMARRGDAKTPGDLVPRSAVRLASLAKANTGDQEPVVKGSGRRDIADAILARENPLPARVFVNRVWHHLFGRGLVLTVDDFGHMGEAPSHPSCLTTCAPVRARARRIGEEAHPRDRADERVAACERDEDAGTSSVPELCDAQTRCGGAAGCRACGVRWP
jgi:hypothetical protein